MIGDEIAHARGEVSRKRELAAFISGDFRVFVRGARDIDLVLNQRFVAQDFPREDEGIAERQCLDEIFLHLAEQPPAARNGGFAPARTHQPHLQHIGLNDGADVHAVALCDTRMRDAPASVLPRADFGEAFVGLQRIAAGGDEIDDVVEILARER